MNDPNQNNWWCSNGCESSNQCEFFSKEPTPPANEFTPTTDFFGIDNSVPYEQQVPTYNGNYSGQINYPVQVQQVQQMQQVQQVHNYSAFPPPTNYHFGPGQEQFQEFPEVPSYPPCQGPQPWNYAYCYGYYGEAPCQFVDVVDMEDFM